ncbi:MAG: hypothetical protein NVSMB48_04560 [Marmoricola sp.]
MSEKSDHRAALEAVAAYHQEQLGVLVRHVGEAVGRFRAGELDAFEADQELFQYSRAAKELWKFCDLWRPKVMESGLEELPAVDWWERGAFKRR